MKLELVAALLLVAHVGSADELRGGTLSGGRIGPPPAALTVWVVLPDDFGGELDSNYIDEPIEVGIETPTLERIAAEGVRFSSAYVNPSCGTTRVSLLSGQHSFRTGIYGAGGQAWPGTSGNSLARRVGVAGAQSFMAGKSNSPVNGTWAPSRQGWDAAVTYQGLAPTGGWRGWYRTSQTQADFVAAGSPLTDSPLAPNDGPVATYLDDATLDAALAAHAARDRSKSMVHWFGLANIHTPTHMPDDVTNGESCAPPDEFEDCFASQTLKMDATLGRLIDSLDMTENVVLIVSDNGYWQKLTTFEDGIRVPMYAIGAGVPRGQVIDEAVSHVDIYATVLDLIGDAGYGGAETLDGYSFAELLGHDCELVDRCWDDRTGIVYSAESASGWRIFRDTVGPYPEYKIWHWAANGDAKLFDLSGYPGSGPDGVDLCDAGDCSALTGPPRLAWNALCDGLLALETGLSIPCEPVLLAAPTFGTPSSTSSTVTATWTPTASGDFASFETRYRIAAGAWSSWTADTTPLSLSGLAPSTSYEIAVRGIDADGRAGQVDSETISTTASGGGATLFDDDDYNVFATHDPKCGPALVGSTSGKNGVRYCDGFEDARFYYPASNPSAATKFYSFSSTGNPHSGTSDGHGGTTLNFTRCNTGTHDAAWANFGAAGTDCTATLHWTDNPQGNADPDGSGFRWLNINHVLMTNMGTAGSPASVGTVNFSFRFYIKFVGDSAVNCFDAESTSGSNQPPAGYPGPTDGNSDDGVCPNPFRLRGSNGFKGWEFQADTSGSGLGLKQWSTWSGAEPLVHGTYTHGFNWGFGPTQAYVDAGCDGSPMEGCGIGNGDMEAADPGYLDWFEMQDEWIAVELVARQVDGVGKLEWYQDNCGGDGLGCSSASQTLLVGLYDLDLEFTDPDYLNGVIGLWLNFWARGRTGEIQFDQLVFRDRSCGVDCDQNIGWMDNVD